MANGMQSSCLFLLLYMTKYFTLSFSWEAVYCNVWVGICCMPTKWASMVRGFFKGGSECTAVAQTCPEFPEMP